MVAQYTGHKDIAIVCIYCEYTEKDSQTPAALLGSIWRQLFDTEQNIPQEVSDLYRKCTEEGATPTAQQISDLLIPLLGTRKIFIIVDALDECAEEPGREHRSLFLQHLLNSQISHDVNLLFTSRPNDEMCAAIVPSHSIPIEAYESDITLYVKGRLREERRLMRNVQKDPSLESDVISTIVRKSKDM
jgi:hypothetical protein